MALTLAAVIGFAAGTAYLFVAGLLIALRPPRRGILPIATYAGLAGLQLWLVYLGVLFPEQSLFFALGWPIVGLAGAALAFGAARYAGLDGTWLAAAFLAVAALGLALLVFDGSVMLEPGGHVDNLGFLLWQAPFFVAPSVAAVLLDRARSRAPSEALRIETLLLLFALVPHLGYTSAVSLLVAFTTPGAFGEIWGWGYLATFGAAIIATLAVSASLRRSGLPYERPLAALVVAAIAAGAVQYLVLPQFVLFGGVFRIVAALLLGYGLLKFGLFGTELKLKWSLDRGALLAVFGGVFFVVDQAAQFFVSAAFGALAGFAAAGLLLLVLRPLQRATARVADRFFPNVQPTPAYFEARRIVVYRSAAQAAARDGVITEKEREMLATLVRELGIAPSDVETVEREVLSRAVPG